MHTLIKGLLQSRTSLSIALALAAGAFGAQAQAAESGLSNFPYGAQTTYAAFVPPPGTTSFFGYSLYIDADSVRDNNGDKIPGVSLSAFALAPRLVHTWSSTFHGWTMTSGAVIEYIYLDVEIPGKRDHEIGPTLTAIEPLYLSRTFQNIVPGNLTLFTGPLLYWPLGSYDPKRIDNTTVNYRSFAWQASSTWNPTPRVDVSLNAAVEFKGKNTQTDYESGDQGSVTFGAGYKPFDDLRWDFGFSGSYTDGLSDDKINGDKVPGGGRTKKFAIGPKFVFWPAPGVAVVAQYHRESGVENGSQGDLFWVECTFPL